MHRLVCLVVAAALPALAGERITLANGFDLRCDHHLTVGQRVRVYPGADNASYIELAPAEIVSIEPLPDPPPSAHPATDVASSADPHSEAPRTAAPLTARDLTEILTRAGSDHNLDVDLLASVVHAESGGNSRARSRAGAQGLMQLMPSTATQLGVHDAYAPDQNVRGGSAYLDALLARYHENLALALAAYNAGPAAVDRYHGIPPYNETRAYVARVIHEFNRRVAARSAEQMRHKPAAVARDQAR